MMILSWCKSQLLALFILAFVEIIYFRESRVLSRLTKRFSGSKLFIAILCAGDFALIFDAVTACTVNMLDQISPGWNIVFHYFMYAGYEIFMALLFWYWMACTIGIPKQPVVRSLSFVVNGALLAVTWALLGKTEYLTGEISNYSMGPSVYICFFSVYAHCAATVVLILLRYREIPRKRWMGLVITVVFIVLILGTQIAFPQTLISSFALVLIVLSIYLNMENPMICSLEHYQNEMILGFATLVENKDDSTGGHIRRSSAYVKLIAKRMKKDKRYRAILTHDYLTHLEQAAPMHDIGKMAISDAILQKPGKLTDEEYEIMKQHAPLGGRIIQNTFSHLLDHEYEFMAYQVARFHHEKWNGKGYPDGLKGAEIPLCARIMAVADVFDAVSSNRCYRGAMPLETCYDIIRKGRGEDFDPDVVDAFLSDTDQVERIYYQMIDGTKQRTEKDEVRT